VESFVFDVARFFFERVSVEKQGCLVVFNSLDSLSNLKSSPKVGTCSSASKPVVSSCHEEVPVPGTGTVILSLQASGSGLFPVWRTSTPLQQLQYWFLIFAPNFGTGGAQEETCLSSFQVRYQYVRSRELFGCRSERSELVTVSSFLPNYFPTLFSSETLLVYEPVKFRIRNGIQKKRYYLLQVPEVLFSSAGNNKVNKNARHF
jgi:hypothetical protein